MIAILDYGLGNVKSIFHAYEYLDIPVCMATNTAQIESATKLILPGIGTFDEAMKKLRIKGWDTLIKELVLHKGVKIMGVCLGMQLLMNYSEEGNLSGLGLIPGEVLYLKNKLNKDTPVPHVGWNYVKVEKLSPILEDLPERPKFYFVHSYYVEPQNPEDILLSTYYGFSFACAIERGHTWGFQFHPERSHRFGITILKNFSRV